MTDKIDISAEAVEQIAQIADAWGQVNLLQGRDEQSYDMARIAETLRALAARLAEEILISNKRGNHIEFELLPQMADMQARLAEVEAALDSIEAEHSISTEGNVWRFWRDQAREMAASACDAKSKLAKAVEALREVSAHYTDTGLAAKHLAAIARATLAKIGEGHD